MYDATLVWQIDVETAESPVWDERSGRLFFADLAGGRILGYGISDGKQQEWQLPAHVGSFGVCESNRLVVAMYRKVVLLDLESGEVTDLTGEVDEPEGHRFNDGKVGPDGCMWVGTSTPSMPDRPVSERAHTAGLYRATPDGKLEKKSEGYVTTNGMAWTPDGRTMFHSDSPMQRIDNWDFDPATGEISNQRRFAEFGPGELRPDGAACDIEGNYWSAGVRNGALFQFSPTAELIEKVDLPCESPSMPCFAGEDLFVTSLVRRPHEITQNRPYNVAGLWRMKAPIAGAPVGRFADK